MTTSRHFCARWSMPRQRVGYTETASPAKQRHNRGFDAAFNICLPAGPVQHEVLRNLEIVRALGGKVEDSRLEISAYPARPRVRVEAAGERTRLEHPGRRRYRWPQRQPPMAAGKLCPEPGATLEGTSHAAGDHLLSTTNGKKLASLRSCCAAKPIIVSGAPLRKVCARAGALRSFYRQRQRKRASGRRDELQDHRHFTASQRRRSEPCQQSRSVLRLIAIECAFCSRRPDWMRCKTECLSSEPHCIKAVSVEQVVAAAHEMLRRDPALPSCVHERMWRAPHNDDSRPPIDPAAAVALSRAAELCQGWEEQACRACLERPAMLLNAACRHPVMAES